MLIPLKDINFVSTKIEINPIVTFTSSSSGITGNVFDRSLHSKSIIVDGVSGPDFVGVNQQNILSNTGSRSTLARFLILDNNVVNGLYEESAGQSFGQNYFEFQDAFYLKQPADRWGSLFDNSITDKEDFNFQKNQFRNSFGIKRIEQRFVFEHPDLFKKNYIKDILYPYYRENIDSDNLTNLYWGFSNYNSLNFYNRYDSNKHSNCLIYPNLVNPLFGSSNTYDFVNSKNFNVSFYINARRENSNDNGCILHVPGVIELYLKQGTTRNKDNKITGYKIGYILGSNTKSSITINTIDNSTSTDYILLNNWHHVSINVLEQINGHILELYVDGLRIKQIPDLSINTDIYLQKLNSFIMIGGRPRYDANVTYNLDGYVTNYFSHTYDSDQEGPFRKKHIVLNNRLSNNNLLEVSTELYNTSVNTAYNIDESLGLDAEISDFRVYKNGLSKEKIENIKGTSVENLTKEKNDFGLSFYLPFYFVPFFIGKNAICTVNETKRDIGYSSFINPTFASTCGGLEVSVENFVAEWVAKTSPNIVIGGSNLENVSGDKQSTSAATLISYQNSNSEIKKGFTVNNIYSSRLDNVGYHTIDDHNFSYKNHMILPNDNGLQSQNFDTIGENWSLEIANTDYYFNTGIKSLNVAEIYGNSSVNKEKIFFEKEYYHVSCEDVYSEYFSKKDKHSNGPDDFYKINSLLNDRKYSTLENADEYRMAIINDDNAVDYFNINNYKNINYEDHDFSNLYNLSNLIYHSYDNFTITNNIINNSTSLGSITTDENTNMYNLSDFLVPLYKINNLPNVVLRTDSNTILRNYKDELGFLPSPQNKTYEKTYKSNTSKLYYKYHSPYLHTEKDSSSLFSIIIDISSQMYNKKIKKNTFSIEDKNILGSKGKLNFRLKDNGKGGLYRADCLTKQAEWNYVGHLIYKEGISTIHHPALSLFGANEYSVSFNSEASLYVHEVNVPCEDSIINKSYNDSYEENIKFSESIDDDEDFVLISGINLHDENLNIIAKTKFAQPVVKKASDNILFRVKMDY